MFNKFELTKYEQQQAEQFIKKHKQCHGLFSYVFTPGGIGVGVTIKCCHCEKEENITDYNCW